MRISEARRESSSSQAASKTSRCARAAQIAKTRCSAKALRALASQRHPRNVSRAYNGMGPRPLFTTHSARQAASVELFIVAHPCRKQGCPDSGQLAHRRPLSAPEHAQATPSFGQSWPISRLGARPVGRAVGIAHRRRQGRGLFSGELPPTDLLLTRSPSATRPPSCRTSSPSACSPSSSRSASTDRSRPGVGLESELGLGLGLGLVLGLESTLALALTLTLPLGLPRTGQPRAARHRLRQGRAHRADHARAGVGARGRALRRRLARAH